jgi:hypothetical protein
MAHGRILALCTAALMSGCVIVPTAPMVVALPGSQKTFEQFGADDAACRAFAYGGVAGPGQAAAGNAAANAAVGTALGAAAGAIIGGATGSAGTGAAIGAGTGLLFGSAAASPYAGWSSYDLQYQYDVVYAQCMYDRGNRVPAGFAYAAPRAPPARAAPAPYPPPNQPPPPGLGPSRAPAPVAPPSSPSA